MNNLREKAEKKKMEAETEKKGKEFGFWGRREREEEVERKPELSLKKSEQKAEHTKQASKAKE